MTFWSEVSAGLLANVFAGVLLVVLYIGIQWFLRATDVVVSYNWSFNGTQLHPEGCHPNFVIRNRSGSRTYLLASIAYRRKSGVESFDNKSLWGREPRPGTLAAADFVAGPD